MSRKKIPGHYCKICGERKANEKFSGKGHAAHICKDCAKLSPEKRSELQTMTRVDNLPFWLSKEQIKWLKEKKNDPREDVRHAAELAFEMRFPPKDPTAVYEELPFFVEEHASINSALEDLVKESQIESLNMHLSSAIESMRKAQKELAKASSELFDEDEEDFDQELPDELMIPDDMIDDLPFK